jgi:hypothetical protein
MYTSSTPVFQREDNGLWEASVVDGIPGFGESPVLAIHSAIRNAREVRRIRPRHAPSPWRGISVAAVIVALVVLFIRFHA